MSVRFDAFHGLKVIRAKDVVSTERNVSRRDAEVPSVIRRRTFHATQELANFCPVTFRVLDPAFETRMLRTFEGLFAFQVGTVKFLRFAKTRFVIKSTAGIDATSSRGIGRYDGATQEARMLVILARLTFKC